MITPRRLDQAGFKSNAGQNGTPVGLVLPGDFGNAVFNGGVLASNATAQSGLINVAGYNSFEIIALCSGGAGYTVKIGTPDYNDQATPYGILFFDVMGAITPTGSRVTAGAGSGVRPVDSWGWIAFLLQGTPATGAADIFVTLLCSTR